MDNTSEGAPKRRLLIPVTNDEEVWRSWAISLAIAALLLIIVAGLYIYHAPDEFSMVRRVTILSPFGVLYVALITFCTVVWRGQISARQADYQQQQLTELARQISSNEVNNLARQLQRGAELMSDANASRVGAGIATLGAVAMEQADRYGDEARALLLDFVQDAGARGHGAPNIERAAAALRRGFEVRPREIVDSLSFEENEELSERSDEYNTHWQLVFGAHECHFNGGSFNQVRFDALSAKGNFQFFRILFNACVFEVMSPLAIRKSRFFHCRIEQADCLMLDELTFDGCEFSGAEINVNGPMPDLRPGKNWFHPEHPPKFVDNPGPPIDPEAVLHAWYPAETDEE